MKGHSPAVALPHLGGAKPCGFLYIAAQTAVTSRNVMCHLRQYTQKCIKKYTFTAMGITIFSVFL
jgi:hypothetical protein